MEKVKKRLDQILSRIPVEGAKSGNCGPEKRELLFEISQCLASLSAVSAKTSQLVQRDVQQLGLQINECCIKLLQTPPAHNFLHELSMLYQHFRLDAQPVLQYLLTTIKAQKSPNLVLVDCTGLFFKNVTLVQPCAKEISDVLLKLIKSNSPEVRKSVLTSLSHILRSGHLIQHAEPTLKLLLKNQDKELMESWASCICGVLVDYPSTFVQWGSVWPELQVAAIKEMETGSHSIMLAMTRARLQESSKQGDKTTSARDFNALQKPDSKKKQPAQIDFARTMKEAVVFFSVIMTKINSQPQDPSAAQQQICKQVSKLCIALFSEFPDHLETIPAAELLAYLSSTINPKTQDSSLQLQMAKEAAKSLKGTAYTTQLQLAAFSLLQANQSLFPLQLLSHLASTSHRNLNQFALAFEEAKITPQTFVDAFILLLADSPLQMEARQLLTGVAAKSPAWLHQLISMFISQVQIQAADLQGKPKGFAYTQGKENGHSVRALVALAEALAELLALCPTVTGGEPVVITTTVFQITQVYLKPRTFQTLLVAKLSETPRQEHGFVLLRGLIAQGQCFIDKHLDSVLRIFDGVFAKPMCQVDPMRLEQVAEYREVYVQEYHTKMQALKAIGLLLIRKGQSLGKKYTKQVGSFVSNAVEFFYLKDPKPIAGLIDPEMQMQAKNALFTAMLHLPCQFYQSKIVTVLHQICDVLVSVNSPLPLQFLDPQDQPLLAKQEASLSLEFTAVTLELFAKLFKSPIVSQANRDQLVQHFLAHTAPSTRKAKTKDGQTVVQEVPYRPDKLLKMQRVSMAIYQGIKNDKNIAHYDKLISNLSKNLLRTADNCLILQAAQLNIELQAPILLASGPAALLDSIEESLTANLRENKHSALIYATAVCAKIVSEFDSRNGTSVDRITNVYLKIFRSPNPTVQQFALHFAYEIAREDKGFRQQMIPAFFQLYYSQQTNQLDPEIVAKMCALELNGQNVYTNIMASDLSERVEVQKAFLQLDKVPDLIYKHLSDPEILQYFFDGGKLDLLKNKCKSLAVLIVDNFQQSESASEKNAWIALFDQLLGSPECSFNDQLDLIKQCIAYQHKSPLQLAEENGENLFCEPPSAETIKFLVDHVSLTKATQKQTVEAMSLALSMIPSPMKEVKLAAFSLLTRSIEVLQFTVEVVGDQEEDESLSPEARELRAYKNNPLFLEQFEAQLFSAIRSTHQAKGADLSHEAVQASLPLVYLFVTLPITQDTKLVAKIVQMLLPSTSMEVFEHEGLVAETQFLRMQTLAKIYLAAKGRIQWQGRLPSKFNPEAQELVLECFNAKVIGQLVEWWQKAVQDSTQQSAEILTGGTYAKEKVEDTLPAIVEALRLSSESSHKMCREAVMRFLTQGLQDGDLYRFYKQKIAFLRLAQGMELDEGASQVLYHLLQLGVAEINIEVMNLYASMLTQVQNPEPIMMQALSVLMQADPDMNQNEFSQIVRDEKLTAACLQCLVRVCEVICQKQWSLSAFVEMALARLCLCVGRGNGNRALAQSTVQMLQIMGRCSPELLQPVEHVVTQIIRELTRMEGIATLDVVLVLLVKMVSTDELVADYFEDYKSESLVQIALQQQLKPRKLMKNFTRRIFETCHSQPELCTQQSLALCLQTYKTLASSEERTRFLAPYMALLFTVLQCRSEVSPRQQAAQDLYEAIRFDQIAMRTFATSNDPRGVPLLSGAEKTAIENIVRQFSQQQKQ